MKRLLAVALGLMVVSAMTVAYAHEKASMDDQTQESLMRLEHQWAEAYVTKDFRALGQILADDYVALGPGGEFQTKAEVMNDLKYGVVEYSEIDTNPMRVRFFGTTAVVVGSDDERSSRMGMDTTGHYDWTDVFVLRDGRWQVVASQGTFMPTEKETDFSVPID